LSKAAPYPAVERLAAFRSAARENDPVLFVYGPGTDDAFVDSAYHVGGIEVALWESLRAAGFERIGFYSLTRKLYFRDEASIRALRPGGGDAAAAAPPQAGQGGPRRMRRGFSGPLGDRVVGGAGARATSGMTAGAGAGAAPGQPGDTGQGPAQPGSAGQAGQDPPAAGGAPAAMGIPTAVKAPGGTGQGLSDPFSVQMFNYLMRDGGARTALVFIDAEETLRHVEGVRGLAGFFASQVSYRPDAPHTCVLVFRRPTLDGVQGFLDGIGTIPALAAAAARQAERRAQPGLVGFPVDAELLRLVHVLRMSDGLQVTDWLALPAAIRIMSAQREEARRWVGRLRELAARGTPLDGTSLRPWVPSAVPDTGGVWERLARMPGLDGVKRHLERLQSRLEADARLRAEGLANAEPGSSHLVFTGNPGTGKTTVARLVGEMYRDLGLLSRGHVIEAAASDLISAYQGDTAIKTAAVIDRALDGVLFIDEAYQLSDQQGGFGKDAIDTLLKRMEDDRDRLVVIAAGYPAKMAEFLAANDGLRSRFPAANVIEFADYDPPVLLSIALGRLSAQGLTWTPGLERDLRAVMEGMYRTRRQGFGNARAMREVCDEIVSAWAERTRPDIHRPADSADIPDRLAVHLDRGLPDMAELLGELDAMIGLQPVKDEIRKLVSQITLKQRRGRGGKVVAPHMLFLGPPGTGKTTVARLIGRIFKALGLLVQGHVHEVGRVDLVAGYLGQTAIKTAEQVEKALDGILFIDEAYSLSAASADGVGNDFGREAIDALVAQMENLRGRIAVIAAGYPGPMEEFLRTNPGLASRFTDQVTFPDYTSAELLEILRSMAATEEYMLTAAAEKKALAWFEAERRARPGSFGNGRAARGLLERMEAMLGERMMAMPHADDAELSTFREEDVPGALR
jgi:SpoVK/Ycf46/Vps4 family AAA+-type ATPase